MTETGGCAAGGRETGGQETGGRADGGRADGGRAAGGQAASGRADGGRADARRNRARVLEAAEAVFARHGPAASTTEVARAAGVGIGTVFRHFPTKEALIEAVVVARLERLRDHAVGLADSDDPGAAFDELFTTVVDGSATKLALVDALDATELTGRLAASPVGQGLARALGTLLQRAQAAGAVRTDLDAGDVISLLVGCSRALQHAQGAGDRRARQRILAVVRDGLRPPPLRPGRQPPAPRPG